MIDAPLALAFTAGLVATVNPCGFAMLPAYLSYFMGLSDDGVVDGSTDDEIVAGGAQGVRQALIIGAVVSGGFLLVFGVVGALITVGLRWVVDLLPWAAIVIGAGVVALGIAMLAGHEPMMRLPRAGRATEGRRYSAVFAFGLSYAVASLSCTLPVFLAVVAGAIPRTNVVSGMLLFVVYGLGMSLVLVVVTLAVALGKRGVVQWLRRSGAHINRISGAILVLAGGYIVWFWAVNLADPLATASPITTVERGSSALTGLIGGRPMLWGGALGVVVVAALGYVARHRRRPQGDRPGVDATADH